MTTLFFFQQLYTTSYKIEKPWNIRNVGLFKIITKNKNF